MAVKPEESPTMPRSRRLPVACCANVRSLALGLALLLLPAGLTARVGPAAAAEVLRPWPAADDSLVHMAVRARDEFRSQQGDSATGGNYPPYAEVGQMGRLLLRDLGRANVAQATAIQATLDSLGLDVEVASDPELPWIVFMLVRNPLVPTSDAVSYIYWFRENDLRMQGVTFPAAANLRIRSWWTARPNSPYETAITYTPRKDPKHVGGFALLRMDGQGNLWNLVQYAGHGPAVGADDEATFADANHDGAPELLVFTKVEPDSYFVVRPGVPPLENEILYIERAEGFVPFNARTIPGPLQTLHAFAELLKDRQLERAQRLMLRPERIKEVQALGWLGLHRRGAWTVEYGESEPWPTWFVVRIQSPAGAKEYVFHFVVDDYSRWAIKDWIAEQRPAVDRTVHGSEGARPDTSGARRR